MEVSRLGKYEIRATIGRGAVGIVYEAWDPIIARTVAVKTLPLAYLDDDGRDQYERFKREAQAAGRLHHPNIVSTFDYGETPDCAYIVMEHLSGPSLRTLLARREPLALPDIVRIMHGLLAGLRHSHRRGVVHRDIKPANVVFSDDGEVKITDFGIAHLESSSMTRVGSVMGTPAYMAPEQVLGEQVDARTDVYSAGVVFYEMLTGRRPFEGSEASIMHKIVHLQPPRPSQLAATVSPGIDAIIAKAIAKVPLDRYQSAEALDDALRAELGRTAPLLPAPADDPVGPSERTVAMDRLPEPTPPPVMAVHDPPPPARPPEVSPALRPEPTGRRTWPLVIVGAGGLSLAAVAWLTLWPTGPLHGDRPPAPGASPPASVAALATPPQAAAEPAAPPTVSPPVAQPATAAAPPPVQPVSDPVEPLRQQVEAIVAYASCSVVTAEVSADGQVRLRGITALAEASESEIQATLQRAILIAAPSASVTWNMRRIDPGFCPVLDLLRPLVSGPARSEIALLLQGNPLDVVPDGEAMQVALDMPEQANRLTLDLFSNDGMVRHLHAGPTNGAQPYVTGTWQAGKPYGDQLITALVTSATLFTRDRPERETAAAYLQDLQAALAPLLEANARPMAGVLPIEVGAR